MNDTTPDFAAYEARAAAGRALAAQIAPANRTALFDALAAAAIASVVVTFDGSGDSGQVEDVSAFGSDGVVAQLPETPIPFAHAAFDGSGVERHTLPARQVIENMAYDFLEQTHGGWEIDDGAYGEFTFTIARRSIQLEFNERYVETTYHQHEL